MRRFEIRVIIERLDKLPVLKRVFHVDIPDKELDGLRDRDFYVYAKTHEIEVSAIELEAERLRAQYEPDSYAKLRAIAGLIPQEEDHVKA